MGNGGDQPVAEHLEDLHQQEQQHDGHDHDIGLEPLITEPHGQIAQTTGPNRSSITPRTLLASWATCAATSGEPGRW